MRSLLLSSFSFSLLFASLTSTATAQDVTRSFERLVTGNGHAMVSYDRESKKIDTFLEHPFRFLEPRNMPEDLCYEADESRDLAYDFYFGVRATEGQWMNTQPLDDAEYLVGTNVIHTEQHAGPSRALLVDSYMWMPSELELPVLVAVAKVTNESTSAVPLSIYSLFNFRLGDASGGREPSADAEGLAGDATRPGVLYEFSDRSAGTMAYVSLGDATPGVTGVFNALNDERDLDGATATTGNDLAAGFQTDQVTLAAGASTWMAVAMVWALDEDAGPKVDQLLTWAGTRSPEQLLTREQNDWNAWHTDPPAGLSPDQRDLWLQSNVILRMGQVREPGGGFGQILASLPPGLGFVDAQWNISWVRDMAYAVAGLIKAGHMEEARAALEFQVMGGPGLRTIEVGGPYRISATRYFGDGQEETDCNDFGPNVEFDGFGLFLWTLGEYIRGGGSLDEVRPWWSEIRTGIADVLVNLIDDDGIIAADSSIWEVHWNGQQKRFTYTTLAAVRGLCDAAMIAGMLGEDADAARYAEAGARIREAVVELHTDARGTFAQSREDLDRGFNYIDAATVEAINWGVVDPTGRVATQTVSSMLDNLTVETGIGLMRNDDGGWYDSQEWVFVDFRVLPALRAQARETRSDALQTWLEDQALANDLQFSELHTADAGDYAGSIPMVGFGAGAYIVALDGSLNEAACGAYATEATVMMPDGGVDAGTDAGPDAGTDGGTDAGVDGGGSDDAGADAGDAGTVDSGRDGDAGFCFGEACDDDGCGCRAPGSSQKLPPLVPMLFLALLVSWRRR